jgi:hypothetical protein
MTPRCLPTRALSTSAWRHLDRLSDRAAKRLNTDFVPIPSSADVTDPDLASAVGSSTFDTDLAAIANADFTTGDEDLLGYLEYLGTSSSSLSVSTILTDLTSSLDTSVSGLGGDLSTLLGDPSGLI